MKHRTRLKLQPPFWRSRWLPTALACWGVAGCSTFITYPGDPLPDTEVATFECYSRYYFVYLESCGFQAVDGVRPKLSELFANSSKIRPGPHWIEIAFESYFGGGGGITDVCAFDIELQPGYRYQIRAHSLDTEIAHLAKHGHRGFYKGSIGLDITPTSDAEESRRIDVTCNFGGGSMCRKDEDCVPHPDIRCFPQEGFSFGACRFKD